MLRYNDYLPEDAPGTLLDVSPDDDAPSSDFDDDDDATVCLSPLQRWFVSLIVSIGLDAWDELDSLDVASLAYMYKHHVSGVDDSADEYFGTYGERTDEMRRNHERLAEFWTDVNGEGKGNGVVLLGMHGVDLAEDVKLVATLQQTYGLEGKEAIERAKRIQRIVQSLPGAFNNPVLTANAIAIQSADPNGRDGERDSIIVGDGVFEFLDWLSLTDDGPEYIHSHEFGHHLQYDLGVEHLGSGGGGGGSSSSSGEETRRWEMMADAFGSYYLAHADGGRMDARGLGEVHRAAFSLGDCEDEAGSHHGTPRQRECASNYGANLALTSYLDGGHRMHPSQLRRLFDEHYGNLLELDDDHCETLDSRLIDEAIYHQIKDGQGAGGPATPSRIDVPTPSPVAGAPQSSGWEIYDPTKDYSSKGNEPGEPPPVTEEKDVLEEEDRDWFETTPRWEVRGPVSGGGSRLGVGLAWIVAAAGASVALGML